MSNVTECIDLYLTDEVVTDAQFRAVIADAHARDLIEHEAAVSYWRNLQDARAELLEALNQKEGA